MNDPHLPGFNDSELRRLLDGIVRDYRPEAVYLIRSHGESLAGPDSDWDLLVVVPDSTPDTKLGVVAGHEALRAFGVAAEVIPTRRARFEQLKNQAGTLSHVAARQGRLVYGS
jgi:hypothetical protein